MLASWPSCWTPCRAGSYLVISHPASDIDTDVMPELAAAQPDDGRQVTFRSHAEVTRFFDGLDLVEPGVVRIPEWRPDAQTWTGSTRLTVWGGVGRKP